MNKCVVLVIIPSFPLCRVCERVVAAKKESIHCSWIDSCIVDLQRIDIRMLPPHLRHREI